jgi:hypothetical protein
MLYGDEINLLWKPNQNRAEYLKVTM